jgi:hypothetical protein
LHALIALALLALFSLALRLACCLVPPLLGLALHALVTLALLALLALVLRALLHLAAAVLLLPLLCGAALRLSGASGLAAARHVLGGRHGNACRQRRRADE